MHIYICILYISVYIIYTHLNVHVVDGVPVGSGNWTPWEALLEPYPELPAPPVLKQRPRALGRSVRAVFCLFVFFTFFVSLFFSSSSSFFLLFGFCFCCFFLFSFSFGILFWLLLQSY